MRRHLITLALVAVAASTVFLLGDTFGLESVVVEAQNPDPCSLAWVDWWTDTCPTLCFTEPGLCPCLVCAF